MRSAAAPFKGPFYYYLAELRKGRSQKYIKRIPKAGGGYKYVYKEHHQGGVGAQEHMKAGAAFKLSFQGQEGHFHIIKAEGDRLIVKHDELHGPDHKGVELTKAELSALLMAEHKPALEADAKKKRARVDKMKRETPRHIGLKRAERLAQEAEARAGVEPKNSAQDTERPDNFETMPESSAPEDTAAKASEAAQLLTERINELRNQQSASISEDEALELDEQILDAELSLRKLERIERKARRAAAKEQAPQAQPVEPPKAEPVKVEPSEAPAGTKTINVTLTNANQINAFKVVADAKNIKAQNVQGQEYEITASPQDFENALNDLGNVIAWEQSGKGGRRTPNAARVKQYRTLRNKLARAVKNAPLIQEEEAPAPKKQTPRAQLLEAAQINREGFAQQAPPTKPAPAPVYAHAQNTKKIVDKALSSKPTGVDLNSARVPLPSKGDLKEMLSEKGRLQRAKRELLSFNTPNIVGQQNPDQDILYALDHYLNGPYVEIEQKRLRDIEKGFKIALRDARGEDLKRVKSEIKRFWREWGGEYVRLQRELVTERTEAEALKKIRPLIPEGALSPKINEMLDRLEQELAERPVSQNEAAHWVFSRETNKATRDNPRQTFRDYLAETAPEQTPRERLTETAREITAPALEPVQTKNALPYEQAHKPRIIDIKRTAARNTISDIIALIDERAGTTINDHRSLAALDANLSAKKIANKESAFSYWGFRQREAGESAQSNPHAAAFEKHLSKRPSHLARRVNASDIAEFTRAHLGIERVNDLKGKENQIKEIAARFARDSFTEALRIGEETRNEAFARITDKGSDYFEAAPNYFKKLIAKAEKSAEQMSTNPQVSREIQSIIPLAKRALTHYQKRAKEIQLQPFDKAEFLEGLKTSTNSRHLIQGEPRGTAVQKRSEALVYEAINQELNKLIEQHKKTEATPKPTPIDHSLIEALEQGPLKQLKKPFRQEEANA